MSRVFFISDLHFSHKNLIEKYREMNVEEHDNLLVDKWNSAVNKKDLCIIVGDFSMEEKEPIKQFLPKLYGNKLLVAGNHDTRQCCNLIKSLGTPIIGCLKYKGFWVTHIPIHPSEFDWSPKIRGNIHGHIHQRIINDVRYYNVSADLLNFTPKLFTEIEQEIMENKHYESKIIPRN